MEDNTFRELRKAHTTERFELCDAKAKDYAQAHDRLWNFKQLAGLLNLPTHMVWAIYFMKHVFAILKYCREGHVDSEPIRGRIYDAQNYLDLLLALDADLQLDAVDEIDMDDWSIDVYDEEYASMGNTATGILPTGTSEGTDMPPVREDRGDLD